MNGNESAFYKDIIDTFIKSIRERSVIEDEKILSNLTLLFESKEMPTSNDLKKTIFLEDDSFDQD
ncbi:MAG: hypothetical protein KF702_06825 [Gammaproteobacteria bacterium]|nr:hypothetical protein [Gammaproteobacteria bacterium]